MTILDNIVQTKRKEVEQAKRRRPLLDLQAAVETCAPPRDFAAAVMADSTTGVNLIAEIKKASPSAGLIVPDFDPVRIARIYADHGAAAISVLTDEAYFQGRLSFLGAVKEAVSLPVLRKDFIVDEYQIYESRAAGGDAILLITEAIGADCVAQFFSIARQLDLTVLVEVHTEENLAVVLDRLGPPSCDRYLLGINSRDLAIQQTDLQTMRRLAGQLPPNTPFVAESGIDTREDVVDAAACGACAVLVGESLLRAADIGGKIDVMLGKE